MIGGLDTKGRADAESVGGYWILDQIGSGGMATVHLACDIRSPATFVAVKRMHVDRARDPEFVTMFMDETTLCTRIEHENVVKTIRVVREGEEILLVLELVEGETLARLLKGLRARRIRTPRAIAARIVCDMLRGLHAAHEATNERGEPLMIVHRDVSPHNVIVGTDGVARLLDFGVAKARDRLQETQKGQLKGKLPYMSVEQLNERPVDRRSDVYTAGIVLWELLVGTRFIEAESEAALAAALLAGKWSAPGAKDPLLSQYDALVLKALSSDPEARYPTALAMAEAVESAIRPASRETVGRWVRAEAREALAGRAELLLRARGRVAALSRLDEPSTSGIKVAAESTRASTSPRVRAASRVFDRGRDRPKQSDIEAEEEAAPTVTKTLRDQPRIDDEEGTPTVALPATPAEDEEAAPTKMLKVEPSPHLGAPPTIDAQSPQGERSFAAVAPDDGAPTVAIQLPEVRRELAPARPRHPEHSGITAGELRAHLRRSIIVSALAGAGAGFVGASLFWVFARGPERSSNKAALLPDGRADSAEDVRAHAPATTPSGAASEPATTSTATPAESAPPTLATAPGSGSASDTPPLVDAVERSWTPPRRPPPVMNPVGRAKGTTTPKGSKR